MAGTPDPSGIAVQAGTVAASQNIVVQARPAPAFQANAFFNPGFQTSSMSNDAFQKCAFQFQGFQTSECDNNSARSGYWRLFFMNMQEEALKQYEEKTGEKVAKEPVVQEVIATADVKVKPKRRVKEIKPFEPELVLPKLKPMYSEPPVSSFQDQLHEHLFVMSSEVQRWVKEFQPHVLKMAENRVKIKQQTEAANDADYRLRLLLLSA